MSLLDLFCPKEGPKSPSAAPGLNCHISSDSETEGDQVRIDEDADCLVESLIMLLFPGSHSYYSVSQGYEASLGISVMLNGC